MRDTKAQIDYLKTLKEGDYHLLLQERRYHDLLGIDRNSPFEVASKRHRELQKELKEEVSLLVTLQNAIKAIQQQQCISEVDKSDEDSGRKYINSPQSPISFLAFSCLAKSEQTNLAILLGQKNRSPDMENLPAGDKTKEIQEERNTNIAELIKLASVRQKQAYDLGCNLIKTANLHISFAEFELLPEQDKMFFALYFRRYIENRLHPITRARMEKLIDIAKNEMYYEIGKKILIQRPAFSFLDAQEQRFLAIVTGKKEKKIPLSREESEKESLLLQRFQNNLAPKEQAEQRAVNARTIQEISPSNKETIPLMADKIKAIKDAVINDNKNQGFEYGKDVGWFLSLPGKEKEHFEFLVENNSRANNFITAEHLRRYLDTGLAEAEFIQRYEKILSSAKSDLATIVSSSDSYPYLERYLSDRGPEPCEIGKIKKVLNSPFIDMLEKEHWERIPKEVYMKMSLHRLDKIPAQAVKFIPEEAAQELYSRIQERAGPDRIAKLGPNVRLRLTIMAIEKKLKIDPSESILKKEPSTVPLAGGSHSFSAGKSNANTFFPLPSGPNSLTSNSGGLTLPPSKKQKRM